MEQNLHPNLFVQRVMHRCSFKSQSEGSLFQVTNTSKESSAIMANNQHILICFIFIFLYAGGGFVGVFLPLMFKQAGLNDVQVGENREVLLLTVRLESLLQHCRSRRSWEWCCWACCLIAERHGASRCLVVQWSSQHVSTSDCL